MILSILVFFVGAVSWMAYRSQVHLPGSADSGKLPPSQGSSLSDTEAIPPRDLPVQGMVTMVDLGAKSCIPCKMMAPILDELEQEYRGRAVIAFIDLTVYNDQARRFGVRAIPTQIFYDAQGNEVHRHEGFMNKGAIEKVLAKLGVEKPGA